MKGGLLLFIKHANLRFVKYYKAKSKMGKKLNNLIQLSSTVDLSDLICVFYSESARSSFQLRSEVRSKERMLREEERRETSLHTK